MSQARPKNSEADLEQSVIEEFHKSRKNYGTRKLKVALALLGFQISRRKIARIMQKFTLISNYTKATFKKEKQRSTKPQLGMSWRVNLSKTRH
ncbi:transposase [Listeria monocytogenes]|nr:transposase [Listeria monocytogenes]ECJ9745799.1 transposase [Listeria monocytogenes]EEO3379165.1 transposase [Listeria monocytogenes]